jgi:uncharacterized protein YabN with tetrapyrrole methylase and pyrophosphatase domain
MKARKRDSIADGLPTGLPSLHRAYRLQDRAAGVGFDWPTTVGPIEKVREETAEVVAELEELGHMSRDRTPAYDATHDRLQNEIGDLLFAVVNLARKAGVHPALALDRANTKFERRFAAVERLAGERGIAVAEAGLAVLDALWDEVKATET